MKLTGKLIFLLGTSKFDGPDQSTSFNIARQLSKENQVYYIDYPLTWKDYIKLRHTPEAALRRKHFGLSSSGIIDTDIANLKVIIVPPMLSINFLPEGWIYRNLLKINEWLIRSRVRKVLTHHGNPGFIYINSFNFHYPGVADALKPALSIYHCVDPMIIPYDMKHGIRSENDLVRKSDVVICTSRQLYDEKIRQNSNTYFIPNAADLSHSAKALDPALPVSSLLDGIKRPVIGYAGAIERRFDYPLLHSVVRLNPDKSFVLVGPVSEEFAPDWLFKTKNVFLPGRISFQDIPALIKGFDVAIIPFKKDDVSRTIFPLKLFEYLGAGKPVVATDFNPDLKEFTGETVSYCSTPEEFSKALDTGIRQDSTELIKRRLEVAGENTWDERGEQIAGVIWKNLKSKSGRKP